MVLNRQGKKILHSPPPGLFFLILVLGVGVSLTGCVEQYAGEPQQPITPSPGEEVQQGEAAMPTPAEIPAPLILPGGEGQSGYISRSFGLVPYGTTPDYRITNIDSVAKRDSAGGIFIQGRVKNEGPANLNYIHIIYHLFDANGNILGNVDATLEYLPAGATWHYTTGSYQTDYYQYYQLAGLIAQ
jgi:hypothetical protein